MKILKSQNGMTMVEVVIAFLVFMLSLVMVTVALQYAISTQARYEERKKWVAGYEYYPDPNDYQNPQFKDGVISNMYSDITREKKDSGYKIEASGTGYQSFDFSANDTLMSDCDFSVDVQPAKWYIRDKDLNNLVYSNAAASRVWIPIYLVDQDAYKNYLDEIGGGGD